MEVLFFLGLFAFMVFAMFAGYSAQQTRQTNLHEFSQRLQNGACQIPDGFFGKKLDGARVQGRYEGRRLSLEVSVTRSGDSSVTHGTYTVDVSNPVTNFEISTVGVMRRFGRWLGVVDDAVLGKQRLDEKYVVKRGGQRVGRLFHSGEMERLLDHVFGMGFDSIELRGERLSVTGTFGMSSMEPFELMRVFQQLNRMARLCERKQVEIKLSAAKATRRFGWTDGGHDVLCPYCRDTIPLGGGGDPVSACEHCNTVHHTECLEEAGGCVVFGCRGRESKHAA